MLISCTVVARRDLEHASFFDDADLFFGCSSKARVVLVFDLADDLLDEVFDRREADRRAVLVDDDRHVLVAGLHAAQQLRRARRFRHEHRVAQHECWIDVSASLLGFLLRDAHRVLDVEDADDLVEALVVDRVARELLFEGLIERFLGASSCRAGR